MSWQVLAVLKESRGKGADYPPLMSSLTLLTLTLRPFQFGQANFVKNPIIKTQTKCCTNPNAVKIQRKHLGHFVFLAFFVCFVRFSFFVYFMAAFKVFTHCSLAVRLSVCPSVRQSTCPPGQAEQLQPQSQPQQLSPRWQ